jgi:hypothetical protein
MGSRSGRSCTGFLWQKIRTGQACSVQCRLSSATLSFVAAAQPDDLRTIFCRIKVAISLLWAGLETRVCGFLHSPQRRNSGERVTILSSPVDKDSIIFIIRELGLELKKNDNMMPVGMLAKTSTGLLSSQDNDLHLPQTFSSR